MGPWLETEVRGVAIGAAHVIACIGPQGGRLSAHPRWHWLLQLGVRDPSAL